VGGTNEVGSASASHIGREDLPALFRVADDLSTAAQRKYILFIRLSLIALIGGSLFSAFRLDNGAWTQVFVVLGAALMAIAFFATLLVSQKPYKDRWYGGRAVAESVKTSAWRYMMGAEPFAESGDLAGVEQRFLSSLGEMIKQDALAVSGRSSVAAESQITPRMRTIRAQPVEDRKHIYLSGRIRDQRAWYSTKAAMNAKNEERLFFVVGIAQLGALVMAIWLATSPEIPNMVGVFATLSASLLAWLQAKRHEELAQSYLVAAQELGLIETQSDHIHDPVAFSHFVADAEAAISREHTLWPARRDTPAG